MRIMWFGLALLAAFIAGGFLVAFRAEFPDVRYAGVLISAVATLAAAFFGARYAYKLQSEAAQREEVKARVEAGNRAIFELVRTYNQMLTIRKQFIDKHRDNDARHVFIMPMAGNVRSLSINFDELSFLFESEDPNLIGRLAMFQQEVAGTLDVMQQRSNLHVENVQPKVEEIEKRDGPNIPLETLERELGPRISQTMRMLTDYMVEGVDGVIESGSTHIDQLHRILKDKFPGHTVIGMSVPNRGVQSTPKSGATNA